MRFDLSSLRQTDWKTKLIRAEVRGAFGVICGVVAGLVLYRIVLSSVGFGSRLSTLDDRLAIVTFSIAAFGSYAMAVSTPRFLSGAESIEITPDWIRFNYRAGLVENLRWRSPKTSLRVTDLSNLAGPIVPGSTYMVERTPGLPVLGRYHRCTWLTYEAFQAILNVAQLQGLRVTCRRQPSPYGSTGSYLIYQVDANLELDRPSYSSSEAASPPPE